MLDTPIDTILDRLHDCLRFRLDLLTFTRQLDLMESDESMANASHSTKVVERVFELRKLEFFLAFDDASQTN